MQALTALPFSPRADELRARHQVLAQHSPGVRTTQGKIPTRALPLTRGLPPRPPPHPSGTLTPVGPTTLHHRLRAAAADRSYRELGELTATHPETVRRYMQGAAPSVEFLSAFAGALNISVEWLLTGAGAMRSKDLRPHVLREASVAELLNAMAQTIERLIMRVERLEAYMQTLETRIRANANDASTPLDSRDATRSLIQTIQGDSPPINTAINTAINGSANHALIAPEHAARSLAPAPSPTAPSPAIGSPDQRARSIADALPQRARSDAGGTPPAGGP